MSPSRRASSASKRWARSLSRARGTISLSVKSRAVSAMSCCSSLSSRSTSGRPLGAAEPVGDQSVERLPRLPGAGAVAVELVPVDCADRLYLAHGRGEECLPGREQLLQSIVALLDAVEHLEETPAGDGVEDPSRKSGGAQHAVFPYPEDGRR